MVKIKMPRFLADLPLLGRKATHPNVWSAGQHMTHGPIGYEADPRWAKIERANKIERLRRKAEERKAKVRSIRRTG